jgi:N-acyl-D-amino-acid deacylase
MDAGYENGQKYNGMNLSEIGELEGMSPIDAVLKIVKDSGGMATQMTYSYSGDNENEWVVEKLMAHDLCLFETDTLLKSRGFQNPASFGAFPQFLGHFVRDKKVLPLSEAVAKMSGRVADRFNIEDRGKLTAGNFADVVIFNPDTIADNTSRTQTDRRPTGIEKVLINGEIIVDGGIYKNDKKSGMALRCSK